MILYFSHIYRMFGKSKLLKYKSKQLICRSNTRKFDTKNNFLPNIVSVLSLTSGNTLNEEEADFELHYNIQGV